MAGMRPLAVQFTDTSTPGSHPITDWSWDFGDGHGSTLQHPAHTYENAGSYEVSLTVMTASGSDLETRASYIQVSGGAAPTADFTASPATGKMPLQVQFTDASVPGDSPITAWLWDFGDGATSTGRNPAHAYTAAGAYDVSLTVTTGVGSDSMLVEDLVRVYAAVHVDRDNASGLEDGTSWDRAFRRIQDGIDAAANLSGGEVWVAEGLYDEPRPDPTGALLLRPAVAIYGGFSGTEKALHQRDPAAKLTVIDGTSARDGAHAYHVVVGGASGRLDGFIIQDGLANSGGSSRDRGAGLFIQNASPVIANCVIRNNHATYAGGGLYNGNAASPLIMNCMFFDNATLGSYLAQGHGGAVYNASGSAARFENCIFAGNNARATFFADGQGGAMYSQDCMPVLVNCTFYGNRTYGAFFSDGDGGGLYNRLASPSVRNCIFWEDFPNEIVNSGIGGANVSYSDIEGGYSGNGNIAMHPGFVDASARDFSLQPGSSCIDSGTVVDAPATDIRGVIRPQGTGVDMGAYESGSLPVAEFAVSATRGVAPFTVVFTDQSDAGTAQIDDWSWDFGDGTGSSEQHPRHTYAIPGTYTARLTVTTDVGADVSDPAGITAASAVTFTQQPRDAYAYAGDAAMFEVEASGGLGGYLHRWWFDDGYKAVVETGGDSRVLPIAPVRLADAGAYWCQITDDLGNYVSDAAQLFVAEPLMVTEQPVGGEKPAGGTHVFHVGVSGGFTPLDYVWKKDEAPVAGGYGDTLVLDDVDAHDAGIYMVEVYDALGTVRFSESATLNVVAHVPVARLGGLAILISGMSVTAAYAFSGRNRRNRR